SPCGTERLPIHRRSRNEREQNDISYVERRDICPHLHYPSHRLVAEDQRIALSRHTLERPLDQGPVSPAQSTGDSLHQCLMRGGVRPINPLDRPIAVPSDHQRLHTKNPLAEITP